MSTTTKAKGASVKAKENLPVVKVAVPAPVAALAAKEAPKSSTEESRFEAFLVRAGAKARINIEKHLAVCDAEPNPNHGRLWRRLAGTLGELAPMPVQIAGAHAVLFFIADGRYRLQVFAMEDLRDGRLSVYLQDVLADALSAKVLKKTSAGYALAAGPSKEPLDLREIDASNTSDPPPHIKHMIGWNRKAIKLSLDANDLALGTAAGEGLCEIAARRWKPAV